ncbi:MAG: hypothetical protein RLZZ153_595 [Pseudomonadota bacterium]
MRLDSQTDGDLFFRVGRLKSKRQILDALRHNKREIQAELGAVGYIDASRSHLNLCLAGPDTSDAGYAVVKDAVAECERNSGRRIRKDAVLAIEIIFSLPAKSEQINAEAFFQDCFEWAKKEFPENLVISADAHLDEANPHLHVILNCIVKGRLIGSRAIGYKRDFINRSVRFFEEVGRKYGLRPFTMMVSRADRKQLEAAVLNELRRLNDPVLKSTVFNAIKTAVGLNPAPFAQDLSLPIIQTPPAPKKLRTMTQVFTSKGKGPRYEPDETYPV